MYLPKHFPNHDGAVAETGHEGQRACSRQHRAAPRRLGPSMTGLKHSINTPVKL